MYGRGNGMGYGMGYGMGNGIGYGMGYGKGNGMGNSMRYAWGMACCIGMVSDIVYNMIKYDSVQIYTFPGRVGWGGVAGGIEIKENPKLCLV